MSSCITLGGCILLWVFCRQRNMKKVGSNINLLGNSTVLLEESIPHKRDPGYAQFFYFLEAEFIEKKLKQMESLKE